MARVRIGDKAEILANYLLEHMAFVTRVPREEDIGIDFLCLLYKSKAKMIEAGPSFSVQIKSSANPIVYSKPWAVSWIANQEQPLFVGVVDVERGALEIYSTWRMLNVFLLKTAPKVRLIPGDQKKGDYIYHTKSGLRVDIYLGKPIIKLCLTDLEDEVCIDQRRHVLREWIQRDRLNLVRREAKMFWVEGPKKHVTNQGIPSIPLPNLDLRFFCNAKNINFTMDNYIRASIAVITDVDRHPRPTAALTKLSKELQVYLVSNGDCLTEWHRLLISAYTKLNFS